MKRFAWLFFVVCVGVMPAAAYAASNYALEIIQPMAGLDTKNRFYKAYPGLVYNVRPGVIGGAYPFTYELTTAPVDMTIDSFTGEINWPSPTASATPYPVSLKVTDKDGTVATVSWTVTVTTSGFRFLDGVNGQRSAQFGGTGDGTITSPWKTLEDVFEGSDATAMAKTTYRYEFLYFKNGTYIHPSTVSREINTSKPMVWIAYPAKKPGIIENLNIAGENFYLDGFDYSMNSKQLGLNLNGAGGGGVTVRKTVFHNIAFPVPIENGQGTSYAIRADAPITVIQDNIFHDFRHGAGVLGETNSVRTLIENNLFYNFGGPELSYAIKPGGGIRMWFIRGNHFYDLNNGYINGINVEYTPDKNLADNTEISYNLFRNGNSTVLHASPTETDSGKLYVHHNTFIGSVGNREVVAGDGPFHYYNNVVVNDSDGTPSDSHITQSDNTDSARIILTDNLGAFPADNVVDGSGNLTSNYSQYVGVRGHQLLGSRQAVPPALPVDPSIYTVNIVKTGTGNGTITAAGINCDLANTDCSGQYPSFGFIEVTVVPDNTSAYDGMLETCDLINPCSFRVNKSQTLTVKFTKIPSVAADYFPLEILQPKGGLSTTNRFYKAYPGLIYNVRAGVIGGAYPYKHELTAAPVGMTIDSVRGEIAWPSPTASVSPYPVTLKVTDQNGRTATVSWTITVTTSGFRFLDAVDGQPSAPFGGTGDGSIGNPWKSILDVFEGDTSATEYKNTYKHEFLYFKDGVYKTIELDNLNSDNKPVVWMAYPREHPVLEGPKAIKPRNASVIANQNPYFEGFEFRNMGSYGFRMQGESGSATLWRNNLHGLMTGIGGCPSPLVKHLQSNESVVFLDMSNLTIQDNVFHDIECGSGIKGYDRGRKVLIEDNTFHTFGITQMDPPQGGDVIAPKAGTQEWFIRANHIYNADGIGIYFLLLNNDKTRNNEVSYNRVNMLAGAAFSASPASFRVGPLYVHHNTFFGPVKAMKFNEFDGPYYFYNNVAVNESSGKEVIGHIKIDLGTAPERINISDHLSGFAADGIIDSDLRLQGVYRDQYLGRRGWELGTILPSAPKNLRIVP